METINQENSHFGQFNKSAAILSINQTIMMSCKGLAEISLNKAIKILNIGIHLAPMVKSHEPLNGTEPEVLSYQDRSGVSFKCYLHTMIIDKTLEYFSRGDTMNHCVRYRQIWSRIDQFL